MPSDEIEDLFPSLSTHGYSIDSPQAKHYNCIAWALHDTQQYWDPNMLPVRGYYWPPGVPQEDTVLAWVRVFEIHGHRECDAGDLEADFEKIAIFGKSDGTATHVARQLDAGEWTSKLGKLEDIRHNTLAGLEGDYDSINNDDDYGKVVQFMKRPRRTV